MGRRNTKIDSRDRSGASAPIVQRLRYGTNTVGVPFRTEGGCWRRVDTYRPRRAADLPNCGAEVSSGPAQKRDSRISDSTRPPLGGFPGYDSRCTSCYLNHSHTIAAHEQSIARRSS